MIAILHNIRSAHNVGSIFRTADAAGVTKLYVCGITPAPTDEYGRPREPLKKVSLGAEKYVAWEKAKSAARAIDTLKGEGYIIYAVEQSKMAMPYYKCKTQSVKLKMAVVMGNEVTGLPKSILRRADKILEIPMHGKKESLNVAVAFGIVAFHFFTQKAW